VWQSLVGGAAVTLRIAGTLRDGWAGVITEDRGASAPTVRSCLAKFPRVGASLRAPDSAVMVRISPRDPEAAQKGDIVATMNYRCRWRHAGHLSSPADLPPGPAIASPSS
jgi:hypothetical protein